MRFFTYTLLGGSIAINSSDSVNLVSIQTNDSSAITVLGNVPFKGLTPNAITLSNGQGITLANQNIQFPLDGITITWIQGSTDLLIAF
jgi:hypothetical protein